MAKLDRETLEQLLDGQLGVAELQRIMASHKDPQRLSDLIGLLQSQVPWDERILLPYAERLFIVQRDDGERVVKCRCGWEFGDYRRNWKLSALIFVRDRRSLIEEIYPPLMGSDPEWMELREFYCPGCAAQLEVEAVPPGYPVIFDFEPDLEALYGDWLEAA